MRVLSSLVPLVLTASAIAQLPAPPAALHDGRTQLLVALQPLTEKAALIFTGTVVQVDYPGPHDQRETVRIYFRVKDGIRGAHSAEVIEIREWKGLWTSGSPRYRAGEDYAMFCYRKNALGVTSPVGGDKGRILLQKNGKVDVRAMRLRGQQQVSYAEFVEIVRKLASTP